MRAALIRAAAAVGIALFALGLAAPRPAVAETCRHSRPTSKSAGSGDVAPPSHATRQQDDGRAGRTAAGAFALEGAAVRAPPRQAWNSNAHDPSTS
jgi:hypothetical protein